jgi:hypothetical protein
MTKVMLITLTLVALVCAEELKAEGRQMNWSNLNFASKPAYQQSSYGSDSSDSNGSPSVQNAQAKSSSSYQGLVSQSLDGQDINRDGSYSAPSSYGSNNDYGYEASPDSSYGNAVGYGYDYQRNLPTPSGRFYSMNNPSLPGNPVPDSYLRGMPREQQDHSGSLLSSMQSGKIYQYQSPSGFNFNSTNSDQMTNRAGYDEDAPLGGISSSSSTGSMLSSTSMRNPISRQDDFSYGTVNGGYGSIPPAAGYGGGAYGYGGVGYGGSYASPGYSSNYRVPYGGYSSYGTPSYSSAGYSGSYGSPLYSGSGYGSSGYGGYGAGGYGAGSGYGAAGYGAGSGYGAAGYGAGSGYGGVYGAGYGGGYGSYGGYGSNYGLQAGFQPGIFKKPKKAFHDWLKGKDVLPYGYGSGYGYGANYAAIPYDYYYDPPGIWHLSKFAMKSIFKSMFKPIFKWLPFCSPFFYARSDRS